MGKGALIDTGPLVAVVRRRDAHHTWARAHFEAAVEPFATCEAVISESFFLLERSQDTKDALCGLLERGIVTVCYSFDDEIAEMERIFKEKKEELERKRREMENASKQPPLPTATPPAPELPAATPRVSIDPVNPPIVTPPPSATPFRAMDVAKLATPSPVVATPAPGPGFDPNGWESLVITFQPGFEIDSGDKLRIEKDIFEVFLDGNVWQPGEVAEIAQFPSIPEPGALALIALIAPAILRRRRAA